MSSIKKQAIGRRDMFILPVKDIHVPEDWNVRTKGSERVRNHIKELATSIAAVGVSQPITVRYDNGKYSVTDGFCRMAAVHMAIKAGADIKGVKVITEEKGTNEADHVASMLIRNDSLELTTYEQALVVKKLLGFGWTQKEIAEKWGKTTAHVSNLILLMSAPPDVHKLVEQEKVSVSLVLDELRSNKDNQSVAVEHIKKAVKNASDNGKGKATKRNQDKKVNGGKGSSGASGTSNANWSKHGPSGFEFLRRLIAGYDTLEEAPDVLADVIEEARTYIEENEALAVYLNAKAEVAE